MDFKPIAQKLEDYPMIDTIYTRFKSVVEDHKNKPAIIENERIIDFIKKFEGKTIGAISIAPLLLVRAGLLNGKPFMAGINKEEIFEEGFSESDLAEMVGWDDNLSKPVEAGYIITGNIITSISYNFVKWALAFGKMLGIDIPAKTFGLQ